MLILRHRAVISLIGVAALSGGMLAACGDDDDTASTNSTVAEAPTTTAPAATTTIAVVVTAAGAATTEAAATEAPVTAGAATEAPASAVGAEVPGSAAGTEVGAGTQAAATSASGPSTASSGPSTASSGVTESSAPGSSLPSEVCADSEALRDSVAQLRGFDIRTQRLTALPSYVTDIKDSLSALRTSGGAALQPAVNDLRRRSTTSPPRSRTVRCAA